MPRYAEVDFTDAPPAQGGQGGDHIPPGKYLVEVKNVAQESARTGRPMFTVILSVQSGEGTQGKTLRDNFALPQTQQDSKYGLQRFHAFLLALGLNISKPQIKFDLDRLTSLKAIVEVYDDKMPPREGYEERIVSKVSGYYPVTAASTNGSAPASGEETPSSVIGLPPPAENVGEAVAANVGAADATQAEEELDDLFQT